MNLMIDLVRLISVEAAPDTKWLFVELVLVDGTSGWGEATLNGEEADVARAAESLFPRLVGTETSPAELFARLPFTTPPEAAIASAVMQAFQDADARAAELPLVDRIGSRKRDRIGLYANINRRTRDRTPAGMANSAVDAVSAGFEGIKIAPFDEVRPELDRGKMRQAMGTGIQRVAAVREALGPGARLMVDCHWRFDECGAVELIDAVASLGPYWIECPVAENETQIELICRLRDKANAADIRLAGLETQIRAEGFRPYLLAGAYDVMMPDVKYAGGPGEMLRIAALLEQYNTTFSPHNPSGPISHAHSMHICGALETCDLLEVQFDETPLFDRLVDADFGPLQDGATAIDWSRAGLGVSLWEDPEVSSEIASCRKGRHS